VKHRGFADVEQRFLAAIAMAAGIDPVRINRPGTVIAPAADREGTGIAALYRLGDLSMVWCDPAVADRVAGLADSSATFSVDSLEAWAAVNGAVFIGGAWSHLIDDAGLVDPEMIEGHTFRLLDGEADGDRALIEGLVAVCGEDDAEYAEIDMDGLDPLLAGLIDGTGELVGFAGGLPWENDEAFWDIGVLSHVEHRSRGLGRSVVTGISREILSRGHLPLYRCNWDRIPSRRLALSVGFREVLSLAAVRFE